MLIRSFRHRGTDINVHFHDFEESKHPRGQPGNKGQFGPGGGGSTATAKITSEPKPDKHSSAAALLQHAYPREISPEHFLAQQPPEVLDKIREVEKKIHNAVPTDALVSKGGHKMPDGSWSPSRRLIHDRIMREILTPEAVAAATPKPGEKPTFTMLGGRGGSGKSWFSKSGIVPQGTLVLDNDAIKSKLPEYEGWNAALLHEEASHLFDRIDAAARHAGLNVAHDATLKTYENAKRHANEYRKHGYQVDGHYMFVPPHISAQRAIKRFMEEGGRYVPPSYILGSTSNESSFDQLRPHFHRWSLYRNDVEGKEPQLVGALGAKPMTKDSWHVKVFTDGRLLWMRR